MAFEGGLKINSLTSTALTVQRQKHSKFLVEVEAEGRPQILSERSGDRAVKHQSGSPPIFLVPRAACSLTLPQSFRGRFICPLHLITPPLLH